MTWQSIQIKEKSQMQVNVSGDFDWWERALSHDTDTQISDQYHVGCIVPIVGMYAMQK